MRTRVLLVEDHPDTSELIQHQLSLVGYDVLIAEDGYQAVAYAAHLLPDIIIMDIMLPKMNGLEATIRIRKNPKTASIPILAATAMAALGDRERCLAAGCNDYLAKPFTYKELAQALSKLLQQAESVNGNVSETVETPAGSGSDKS